MAGECVVDFYYSIGSRYSYLASTQIAKLERETGCRVRWHPVNGADIRTLRGRDPFAGEPLSGQYEGPIAAMTPSVGPTTTGSRFVSRRAHTSISGCS